MYSSLFRLDENVQGEIEDFLGPETSQYPLVCGSILTQQEREALDKDLSPLELDKALDQANLKSTPGVDGFSYGFIKKFWNIYRTPLYKCTKTALCTQRYKYKIFAHKYKSPEKHNTQHKINKRHFT